MKPIQERVGVAERPELRSRKIVPLGALHAAQTVNRLGRTAVHEGPILEKEAWDCLTSARQALICILKGVGLSLRDYYVSTTLGCFAC
jgi:hypothetical protein